LDLGDTSGTTNKDNLGEYMRLVLYFELGKHCKIYLIDIFLLNVGVLQDLLDRLHSLPEEVHVEFFEFGTGKGLGEVIAIFEALDFDASALLAGQCPLGFLNLALEFTESAKVLADVSTSLFLVRLDKVFDDSVVEIFTSEMGVTSGGQNFEDTVVDGEKGNIEGSSSEIVNDDLGFTALLVETVGDGGGGRLVDDTEDLETGDGSGILGGLALSVVEV